MSKNVGSADRYIRIGLGIAIIVTGVITQNWWGLIGLVPLVTASLNFCPLYSVIGASTCKK
jgi:hypothetical protein